MTRRDEAVQKSVLVAGKLKKEIEDDAPMPLEIGALLSRNPTRALAGLNILLASLRRVTSEGKPGLRAVTLWTC